MTLLIRVKSHRARDKMKAALGYLPQGYYSFDFDGEFREVPADCYKEASQAARNTAREVLAKAWTEYLAAHPQLSRQAEQAKAAHEVAQLESELADLESKAAAKKRQIEKDES